VAQVSARVVQMFQRYAQNINPKDEHFLSFIDEYLTSRNIKDPKGMPCAELYNHIKEAIRQYLRQLDSARKPTQPSKREREIA
jgi:hypothetical protein